MLQSMDGTLNSALYGRINSSKSESQKYPFNSISLAFIDRSNVGEKTSLLRDISDLAPTESGLVVNVNAMYIESESDRIEAPTAESSSDK